MKLSIVGIMMVKNEELWIGEAIRRIVGFCDYIRVVDTGSTDDTIDIARRELMHTTRRYDIVHESNLTRTHDHIEAYIGRNVWVFGVDGDELYDPIGLAAMRARIMNGFGKFCYQVKGMYLHVDRIDGRLMTGWVGPPSHNPTKLYNFANITAWPNDFERTMFHCKTRVISHGAIQLNAVTPWEASELRCLHMRFVPRTTSEVYEDAGRLTPEDMIGHGSRKDRGGRDDANERLQYRKGDRHTVDMDTFKEVACLTD